MSNKIIIITNNYPSIKEEFIEDELKVINKYFDRIIVLSLSLDKNIVKYVPGNAKIKFIRQRKLEIKYLPRFLAMLLRQEVVKEILFPSKNNAKYELKIKLKSIFIYIYIATIVEKSLMNYEIESDTILYSYWLSEAAFGLYFYKKRHPNIRCISRAHGSDLYIDKNFLPFRKQVLSLDQIHCISKIGADHLYHNFSNKIKGKIYISRLGVFCNHSSPYRKEPIFYILSCSNIIKLKRIDLIIDSIEGINDIEIRWKHFGSGIDEGDIIRYAAKLKQKYNIRYEFLGFKERDEIINYYKENKVDLFINLSDYEGIPVSIMEAMSFGIPVIARNVGGISEIVNNNNGYLLNQNVTPDDVANVIRLHYLKTEKEILFMRKQSEYMIKEYYNAEKNYNQFLKLIASK